MISSPSKDQEDTAPFSVPVAATESPQPQATPPSPAPPLASVTTATAATVRIEKPSLSSSLKDLLSCQTPTDISTSTCRAESEIIEAMVMEKAADKEKIRELEEEIMELKKKSSLLEVGGGQMEEVSLVTDASDKAVKDGVAGGAVTRGGDDSDGGGCCILS